MASDQTIRREISSSISAHVDRAESDGPGFSLVTTLIERMVRLATGRAGGGTEETVCVGWMRLQDPHDPGAQAVLLLYKLGPCRTAISSSQELELFAPITQTDVEQARVGGATARPITSTWSLT